MLVFNTFESAQRTENHYQTILIFDKVNILIIELKVDFYQ